MLNGFGRRNSAESTVSGDGSHTTTATEEHRSLLLLDDDGPMLPLPVLPPAPTNGNSIVSYSSHITNDTTNTTTGMNPQDDLEQSLPERHPLLVGEGATIDAHQTNPGVVGVLPGSPSSPIQRKRPKSLLQSQPGETATTAAPAIGGTVATTNATAVVSRRKGQCRRKGGRRRGRGRANSTSSASDKPAELTINAPAGPLDAVCSTCLRTLCFDRAMVRNTLSCMNVMARVLVWMSFVVMAVAVVWYSREFYNRGTEKHLIAWFSAGAFVLLGFPLSIASIVGHLSNYNQPHVQCYIVRILWMVPMYSIESWLCLKYHEKAIYIETLRDFYESFVLYSFFQFLIEVLGGEEALILMLKDKSPTRGSHMWGLQWCVKPWLMGQPVRRSDDENDLKVPSSARGRNMTSLKRVHWKSPFFVKCKFGVLQYVLCKFVCSSFAMILQRSGMYNEGDFSPKGGYLYICFVTNISQCWALYCLILFYYATHNELGPIRPVGKFLSVKALVFFTWWQSVGISILYQMDMLPRYNDSKLTINMSPEDVAKGIQDYLICIEMFFAAIAHTLVFPHTEYSQKAVEARARALNQSATNPSLMQQRRVGRHGQRHTNLSRNHHHNRDDKSAYSGSNKSNFTKEDHSFFHLEMTTLSSGGVGGGVAGGIPSWEDPISSNGNNAVAPIGGENRMRTMSAGTVDSDLSPLVSPGPAGMHDWASSPHRPYSDSAGWDTPRNEHQETFQQSTHPALHSQTPSILQPAFDEGNGTIDEGVEEEHYWDDSGDEEGDSSSGGDFSDEVLDESEKCPKAKHNFVRAFLDSAIPRDLRDNTVGIVKGDYVVEKKTLLHHATTSDHYDLFSHARRDFHTRNNPEKRK